MGTWGVGLYSNDTASDVRDLCNDVYPLVGIENGTQLIFEEFSDTINADMDNDYADFWFALADWQWKHGILTAEIRDNVISLLENHTGIEEWRESGSPSDVKKRIAVMEKLLSQLKSPQPEMKLPKPKIAKPKHKPGDIIIVRTCKSEADPENWIWNIENCQYPFIYPSEISNQVCEVLTPPYDAHDRYIAILCIGTEKTPYLQCADRTFYDIHSVYAFYDYIGEEKPTLDTLKKCGFLPKYLQYADETGSGISTSGWCYQFLLLACSFRLGKTGTEQSIEKLSCIKEADRFHRLFNAKSYLSDISQNIGLYDAFAYFFEEKARLSKANIKYDNLLDITAFNPPLRPKDEISNIIRRQELNQP